MPGNSVLPDYRICNVLVEVISFILGRIFLYSFKMLLFKLLNNLVCQAVQWNFFMKFTLSVDLSVLLQSLNIKRYLNVRKVSWVWLTPFLSISLSLSICASLLMDPCFNSNIQIAVLYTLILWKIIFFNLLNNNTNWFWIWANISFYKFP